MFERVRLNSWRKNVEQAAFVTGHDLGRAVLPQNDAGFSP
jgi:hypothetical protein